MRTSSLPAPLVLVASYLAGSLPFSGWAARIIAGADLREHGTGTVSGTSLYQVAGFGPLAVAGSLDVAKGALGPLLAGRRRPWLGALAAACGVAGHNWSPFLGGAGGRGVSPALGASLALAPEATAVLGTGLALGRLARQTGLGTFLAIVSLPPLLARRRGERGLTIALALAVPMLAKRVAGNGAPAEGWDLRHVCTRLFFDRDPDPA
jgi:glycerol-3-phosphate acyltransferase PlsY